MALLLAGAATLLIGACATTPAPTASIGLQGSVTQFREDEVRGQVRVRLVAPAPEVVRTVTLRWAGLAPGDPAVVDYPLAPGVPVDLPVPLPPAACGTPARADAPPPPTTADDVSALVTLAGADGAAATTQLVPLEDAGATLTRVFTRACRQQALAEVVEVRFAPEWRAAVARGVPVSRGTLEVSGSGGPNGGAAAGARVLALDGSVLLAIATAPGADPLPAAVPSAGPLRLPVEVTSTGRCDGHALGESKQTYVFDVTVDVSGDRGLVGPQPVTVAVPEAARPGLWATLQAACAALASR